MKKLIPILGIAFAGILIFVTVRISMNIVEFAQLDKRSVKYNGQLHVDGNKILNSRNEETQLTGISTHGIQWFDELYDANNVAQLKTEFGINVFRIAMYTDPNANGYISNPSLKNKVYELIDAAIEQDIYAIVDWHILDDNNPQTYQSQAIEFFTEVSAKYPNQANIIYEICNEPNGTEITWTDHIKPYAEAVIPAIRANSPNALIIVGTPDWSKDLASVDKAPLSDSNVAYALHFYAGSHNKTLRDKIDEFRDKNLAVFVSECGASDYQGDGKLYDEAFKRWTDYMNARKISWVFWSYSNKNEVSSILEPDYVPTYPTIDSDTPEEEIEPFSLDEHLSAAGKMLKNIMKPQEDK